MFCTKCGAAVPAGAAFCTSCGQSMVSAPGPTPLPVTAPAVAAPAYAAPAPPPVYAAPAPPYAGFWLRFVAYIIDALLFDAILFVIAGIGFLMLGGMAFVRGLQDRANSDDPTFPLALIFGIVVFSLIAIVGVWLYFAMMESSAKQGTLGKIAMGLTVTDLNGQRISFGRASGRFFSKIITGLIPLWIGWIMAGFTEKKQALHDMIASTLVFRKV
jgi:uncharacterized RDD family membrane protein YckC